MEVLLMLIDKDKFSKIKVTTSLTLGFDLLSEMVPLYSMMVEQGIMSKEKAMEKLGISNPKAELEKILEERKREIIWEWGIEEE